MTEAETGRPDAIDSAIKAWRDAFAALTRMPVLFGLAMPVMLALSFISLWFLPLDTTKAPSYGFQLVGFIFGLVQGFLITPVAIAVHRHVLLGEVTQRYTISLSDPRFLRFFLFTIVFQLLIAVPGTLYGMIRHAEGVAAIALGIGVTVLFVIVSIAALRMLILFPAIAVDAPNGDWRNALRDTRGHTWHVFFVMLVTALPLVVVNMSLYFLLAWPSGPSFSGGVILAVANAVLVILGIAAYAAAASRLYYAFSARLGRPPGLAAPA